MRQHSISLVFIGLFLMISMRPSWAQLVRTEPAIPTIDEEITIIYDPSLGTGELVGASKVYMHSSIGTDPDVLSWDDEFTVGNWGQDDGLGEMTQDGDFWKITIVPRDYYDIPQNVEAVNLAMVFRNADGSLEGKTASGGDIFLPFGLSVEFEEPSGRFIIPEQGSSFGVLARSLATLDEIRLYVGDELISSASNTNEISHTIIASSTSTTFVRVEAELDGEIATDEFYYFTQRTTPVAPLPSGVEDGINYLDDNTVVLVLRAPFKDNVYVLGDFNNWEHSEAALMNRNTSNANDEFAKYWLRIENLEPGTEYAFHYVVDNELFIADPYSEKVLDPWHDGSIPEATYPNLKPFPFGKTENYPVTVIETGQEEYTWQVTDFQRPDRDNLVIYELLLREFTYSQNYQSVIDTLDYLQNLGVNAIELMPVKEFEGNNSWGYNPSFFLAVDKYYGTREDLKRFVDECHKRGMAVILDQVLNHAFGQCPLVRLYADESGFNPNSQNIWLNQTPRHPFNVGSDFNHESVHTQYFVDRVNKHWIEEYKIDGYRFDLSKGFTQNFTDNVGDWNQYDQSRIDLLTRMYDKMKEVDEEVYPILEHFGNLDEETELKNRGFMLWGNLQNASKQLVLGYQENSNMDRSYHGTLGWSEPALVTYQESHDEERLIFDALQFGNSSGDHDATQLATALQRKAAAAAIFYTVPGPKMLWQFGELGYDVSIQDCVEGGVEGVTYDYDCRIVEKPTKWEYFEEEDRRELYNTFSELFFLRSSYSIFHPNNTAMDVGPQNNLWRRVKLEPIPFVQSPSNPDEMSVVVLSNLNVVEESIDPAFQTTGTWYDYFSGEELEIGDGQQNNTISLDPGTFKIYTNVKLPGPGQVPEQPQNLEVNLANGAAQFTWAKPSVNAAGFKLYRGVGDGEKERIATLGKNRLSYTDEDIEAAVLYQYELVAFNKNGASEAREISVALLDPISDLSARLNPLSPFDQVILEWTYPSDQVSFVIFRATDESGPFEEIAQSEVGATSFMDTDLEPLTDYFYQVRAQLGDLQSEVGNTAETSTQSEDAPFPPDQLQAEAEDFQSIALQWLVNDDKATFFHIERATSAQGPWEIVIEDLPAEELSFLDEGLMFESTYFYRVKAGNEEFVSGFSNVANATTLTPPAPPAPENLTATARSDSRIGLQWEAPEAIQEFFSLEISHEDTEQWSPLDLAIDGSLRSYEVYDLRYEREYSFRLSAYRGSSFSDSVVVSAVTFPASQPAAKPVNFRASRISAQFVQLAWEAPLGAQSDFQLVRSYDVEEEIEEETVVTTLRDTLMVKGTQFHYKDQEVMPNESYDYQLFAMRASIRSEAAELSLSTLGSEAPTAPSIRNIRFTSAGNISLIWEYFGDIPIDSFEIQRREFTDGNWELLRFIDDPQVRNLLDLANNLRGRVQYFYRIRSYAYGIPSPWSGSASVKTEGGLPDIPVLNQLELENRGVRINWSYEGEEVERFFIERSEEEGSWDLIGEASKDSRSFFDDRDLVEGTEYFYRVLAVNAIGNTSSDEVGIVFSPVTYLENQISGYWLYPNPNTGQFKLRLPNSRSIQNLSIFTLSGQVLESYQWEKYQEEIIITLDNKKNGIYLLRVNVDGKDLHFKFQVE